MRRAIKKLMEMGLEATTWNAALAKLKGVVEMTDDLIRERCSLTIEK